MIGTGFSPSFDPVPALTNSERQRRYRETHGSDNEVRRRYRTRNSKHETDAHYLARPIIMLDGEGLTIAENGEHIYTMFGGMSSVDMQYRSITNLSGLSSAWIFDFILELAADTPGAIIAIYGGSYDFNMMLRDLTREDAERIYKTGHLYWDDFTLTWRRGKNFRIGRGSESAMIYDVVSFFQRPFVDACDEYLCALGHDHKDENGYILHPVDCWENRNGIIRDKAKRGSFTVDDMAEMGDYNASELRNGIRLIQELRARLNKVTLRPRRWDGPGAIAASLLLRERIKEAMKPAPNAVAQAARHAYAGGRFEVLRFGHVERPAWEYDINSAYPSALRNVPNLARGEWEYTPAGEPITSRFALVRIQSHAYRTDVPAPLFCRLPNGSICYPQDVTGWYWTPEYDAVRAYAEAGYGEYRVLGAWQYREDVLAPAPFGFIEPLFLKRKALKKGKDGAHVGIKLALNSLYGKLAQQVGAKYDAKTGTWRLPPFHQIEWAGYTTSHCRAELLKAALTNMSAIIAFETDALFSTAPLSIMTGEDLGDFEVVAFTNLTYVQSGVYFADNVDGTSVTKSRGVDRGDLNRAMVLDAFVKPIAAERVVKTSLTRFVGLGVALAQNFERWRRWEKLEKAITVEPIGKRIHSPYCGCTEMTLGVWHETLCPYMGDLESAEYPVAWINPNPAMSELEELRNEEKTYE